MIRDTDNNWYVISSYQPYKSKRKTAAYVPKLALSDFWSDRVVQIETTIALKGWSLVFQKIVLSTTEAAISNSN